MAIDVTVFVNNLVKNNPNVSANVKKGVSTATAMFAALQTGNLNATNLIDTSKLSPSDQANLAKFNSATGSIQSGTLNPASFVDTSKLSASDQANLAKFNNTVSTIQSGQATNSVTGLIAGGISSIAANIKSNISSISGNIAGNAAAKSTNKGPEEAAKQNFENGAAREILTISTAPNGIPLTKVKDSVPILLQSEVKALMMQISHMETMTTVDYKSGTKLGRYAVDQKTLKNYGYLFSGNSKFNGKDGVKSETEFLYDNNVQDRIMETFIVDQYKALIKNGAIRDGDKKEVVAGMIAVAYQFQDASPGLSDATSVAKVIGAATSLAGSLTSSLASGSGATPLGVQGQLGSSGVISASQDIINKNPTSAAVSQGGTTDKAINPAVQSLVNQAATATSSVAGSVVPNTNSSQQQASKAASSVQIDKLKSATSEMVTMIPANAAKDWRTKGGSKDSQKRPGSLFYNAGRYAITVLAADVAAPAPAAESTTPPPTVAI
ncbi:hypothetical protein UFOVP257_440 [uncultured Caudovirales phage]|uniref:Uncharacterized protein n=1 Tax=uncultured Caudovirales phage TaxID=2100421 RepID=A0A6J5LG88_9CAUD|nr:hypothetical protein UFOVP257_440 [uncultured Caudovirales phage]